MKKSLSVFAAFAIALIGYSSCQDADTKLHVEKSGPHKVAFLANLDTKDTKTALELRIVPNWKYTPEANIHLFETYQSSTIEGHDAVLTTGIDGDYNSALLEAEFDEQQSIIVDPPTRAGVADGAYAYTAIIAKQVDSKYVVPAVQNPDDNSSFDPNADFVIGKRIVSETPYQAEPMRLLFERPVALGRLAFYGLEAARDEKILSVKIEAVDPITGYVTYDDIDFDNGTATFNTTDGSNVITMNYGAEGVAQKSVFYAYYIMVPGTHQIKSISLTTDKFVYTKTNAQPATMSFDCKEFKNIAVSMVGIEGVENVDTRADQTIEWKKGGQTISVDSYDLASAEPYVAPVIEGAQTTLTYSSSDETVATVSADGQFTLLAEGETEITATAAEDDSYHSATVKFTLTVTNTPKPESKTFYKVTGNTIVEGTYLLVYTSGTPNYAFDASKSSGSGGYRQEVSPSNDRITATDALKSAEVQITAKNGKYFLKTSQGYVYRSSSSLRFSNTANDNYLHSASISNGVVTFSMTSGSSSYNLRYSASSNTFQYGTFNGELTLYLLEGSAVVTKAERNLAFASATVTKTVGDAAFTNTLSGVTTGVSYSSDNEDVATVNATSGLVSIVGAGTAVITASAAEDADYQADEASFTLTVNNQQPTGEAYFVKVTTLDEIVEGETYIITNTDATRAFKGILDGTTFKNSGNTVTVQLTDSKIMDSDALADCKLTFGKHATDAGKYYITFASIPDYYFYVNYNGNYFAARSDKGYSQTIAEASNGNFKIYRSSYYLAYYNSAFTYRTSSSSQVSIYKLVNGSVTPTPPVTSGVTYRQVTAVTSGKTYLIVSYDDKYALNSTGTSKENAVTAVSGVISSESAMTDCEFVATVSGTGTTYYQFRNASNGYLAYSSSDPYYRFTSSAATGSSSSSTTRFTLDGTPTSANPTFFFLSEYLKSGKATEYLYYKPSGASGSGTTHFRVGASGSSSNSFGGVHLYEKQ